MDLSTINIGDLIKWGAAVLACLVSILTLYNAAKLKTGILAVSTYAFGAGMLCLFGGFLALLAPPWATVEIVETAYNSLFLVGFILLGLGSYKIYKMSKV